LPPIEATLLERHVSRRDNSPDDAARLGKHHQKMAAGFCLTEDLVQPLPTATDLTVFRVARLPQLFESHPVPGLDLVEDVVIDLEGLDTKHPDPLLAESYTIAIRAANQSERRCRRTRAEVDLGEYQL